MQNLLRALTVSIALSALVLAPLSSHADTAPLQGGVQKVTVTLDDLRTVGLDLKNVLKAVDSLYDEVTIQPVDLVTEPEVIGRGIVINIPISTTPAGPPAPARKPRVDLAMTTMQPSIAMFKTNVDAFTSGEKELDLPADLKQTLQPQLSSWVQNVNALASQEAQLETLTTKGPPYDQPGIAAQCTVMQKTIKSLDDDRRQIYKVLKKHAKQLAKK